MLTGLLDRQLLGDELANFVDCMEFVEPTLVEFGVADRRGHLFDELSNHEHIVGSEGADVL